MCLSGPPAKGLELVTVGVVLVVPAHPGQCDTYLPVAPLLAQRLVGISPLVAPETLVWVVPERRLVHFLSLAC